MVRVCPVTMARGFRFRSYGYKVHICSCFSITKLQLRHASFHTIFRGYCCWHYDFASYPTAVQSLGSSRPYPAHVMVARDILIRASGEAASHRLDDTPCACCRVPTFDPAASGALRSQPKRLVPFPRKVNSSQRQKSPSSQQNSSRSAFPKRDLED